MGGAPSPRVNPGASTATGPPVGMVTGAADTPPRRVAADDRSELEPADSSEEGGRGAELEAIKNKVLTVVYVSWALNMSQVSARARRAALQSRRRPSAWPRGLCCSRRHAERRPRARAARKQIGMLIQSKMRVWLQHYKGDSVKYAATNSKLMVLSWLRNMI